jgi:hypothetical protein
MAMYKIHGSQFMAGQFWQPTADKSWQINHGRITKINTGKSSITAGYFWLPNHC